MYNRLFTKILDSSIWLEPDSTRIVWITLLVAMDQDGYAHFSALENLAARAHVSLAKAKRAIECFESPDPDYNMMPVRIKILKDILKEKGFFQGRM